MAKKLIDVSVHQGVIDWDRVRTQIDGAILRVGYGDNLTSQDDKQFKHNADECTRLGIPFGVYIYSYAKTVEQAKSEAAHVLRLIKGYRLAYPVYLDLEEKGTEKGAIERAHVFGDIIEAAGYWCGVYANLYWWNNHLKGLDRFTKWVAQYNRECTFKGSHLDVWQYTSEGRVVGIAGNVDMNECYRDLPTEILGKEDKPAPAPAPAPVPPAPKAGDKVKLSKGKLYLSSTGRKAVMRTGTFYLYDGKKVNGRYRVTNKPERVNKKPVGLYVSGWVEL